MSITPYLFKSGTAETGCYELTGSINGTNTDFVPVGVSASFDPDDYSIIGYINSDPCVVTWISLAVGFRFSVAPSTGDTVKIRCTQMTATGSGALVLALTAQELITDCLIEIGVLGIGETAGADESAIALRYLNRLIPTDNIFKAHLYGAKLDTFTLTASQQTYTWGIDPEGVLSADIQLDWPTFIQNIVLRYQSSPTIERMPPMHSMTHEQWAELSINDDEGYPTRYYWDKAYPLGTLYLNPVPDSAYTIELWTMTQSDQVAALSDAFCYPPGYEDYFHYELSFRLCRPFRKSFSSEQMRLLGEARDRIAAFNMVNPDIELDPALAGGGSSYSWRNGE